MKKDFYMSREIFEQLNEMSVDEIINLDDSKEVEFLTEEFDHPLTDHEATNYFQSRGVLSCTEFNTLMHNKMKELWENDCRNGS